MKNIIILLFALFSFISCSKKNDTACTPASPESESTQMAAFCDANGISYTVDSNGIYYQVVDQGSGITPNADSKITVTYIATTLDETVVEDKTISPVTMPLSQFIEGWRIAIPYIQKGGRIKMVLPSSLAYGCTGNSNNVGPNLPLYYDVVLINVE